MRTSSSKRPQSRIASEETWQNGSFVDNIEAKGVKSGQVSRFSLLNQDTTSIRLFVRSKRGELWDGYTRFLGCVVLMGIDRAQAKRLSRTLQRPSPL